MAYTASDSRLVIGYDNLIVPEQIASIALGNATADAAYPVDNLKFEDPWRMLKVSTTPSGSPQINVVFNAAVNASCAGFVNHNLADGGYAYQVLYSTNGTDYTQIGSISAVTNGNVLLRFNSINAKWWRFMPYKASAWTSFRIGALFLGTKYEVETNPENDGGFNVAFENPVLFSQSSGNAKHLLHGPDKWTSSAELLFRRVSATMSYALTHTIGARNRRKMIAMIPPDQVTGYVPLAYEHFFGVLQGIYPSPSQGIGGSKINVVMRLEGVM